MPINLYPDSDGNGESEDPMALFKVRPYGDVARWGRGVWRWRTCEGKACVRLSSLQVRKSPAGGTGTNVARWWWRAASCCASEERHTSLLGFPVSAH
ncbi:hypothetical protein GOBAR_DD04924 [Gossypium barbadense]|nr:hypothetical protein GOBAR_DD04924 [Gossypium barbadense]